MNTIQKFGEIIKDDEEPLGWVLRAAVGIIILVVIIAIVKAAIRKKSEPEDL